LPSSSDELPGCFLRCGGGDPADEALDPDELDADRLLIGLLSLRFGDGRLGEGLRLLGDGRLLGEGLRRLRGGDLLLGDRCRGDGDLRLRRGDGDRRFLGGDRRLGDGDLRPLGDLDRRRLGDFDRRGDLDFLGDLLLLLGDFDRRLFSLLLSFDFSPGDLDLDLDLSFISTFGLSRVSPLETPSFVPSSVFASTGAASSLNPSPLMFSSLRLELDPLTSGD